MDDSLASTSQARRHRIATPFAIRFPLCTLVTWAVGQCLCIIAVNCLTSFISGPQHWWSEFITNRFTWAARLLANSPNSKQQPARRALVNSDCSPTDWLISRSGGHLQPTSLEARKSAIVTVIGSSRCKVPLYNVEPCSTNIVNKRRISMLLIGQQSARLISSNLRRFQILKLNTFVEVYLNSYAGARNLRNLKFRLTTGRSWRLTKLLTLAANRGGHKSRWYWYQIGVMVWADQAGCAPFRFLTSHCELRSQKLI